MQSMKHPKPFVLCSNVLSMRLISVYAPTRAQPTDARNHWIFDDVPISWTTITRKSHPNLWAFRLREVLENPSHVLELPAETASLASPSKPGNLEIVSRKLAAAICAFRGKSGLKVKNNLRQCLHEAPPIFHICARAQPRRNVSSCMNPIKRETRT